MRLGIEFIAVQELLLPWDYMNWLRGLFYEILDGEIASEIHERGLETAGKRYKLFTFSLLYPRSPPKVTPKGLKVWGAIRWWLSSPLNSLMEQVVHGFLNAGEVNLGPYRVEVSRIHVAPEPEFKDSLKVKTLSPITASTGRREAGKFEKLFLSPKEPNFSRVLQENLRRKFQALYGRETKEEISFTFLEPYRSKLFTVKGTNIRGWEGKLVIKGDSELMALGYQAGLGEHNGSGFGMVEIADESSSG